MHSSLPRKWHLLFLAFCHFALLFFGAAPPLAAQKIITVGVYNNEPTIFVNEERKAQGIFIDILEDIAKRENWTLVYEVNHFEGLLQALKNGKLDLLPAVAYSKERERFIDFNYNTVITNWAQLYSTKDIEINSFLDLKEKIIAVKAGDIHFQALKTMLDAFNLECRFWETDSYQTTFEMIQTETSDVALTNRLFGELNRDHYDVQETAVIFNPIEMRFAAPKNKNQDILTTIDTYLQEFRQEEDSIYQRALNKWLVVQTSPTRPSWLLNVLYITIGVGFSLAIALLLFRNQVKNRTKELEESNKNLLRQIAEREKAEESLKKYARVVEASSDAIALFDGNHKHVLTNSAYVRIARCSGRINGKSICECLGRDFYEIELQEPIERSLSGETVHIQTRPRAGHTNEFYWNVTISPYFTASRTISGYVLDIHDVTTNVELQNRLKNAQKMEAIGMLAGGVAHDLNNILSGLVSYPDMLLINRGPSDPMTKPLQTIKKSGERAATIVQDLLTLARRGVGNIVITNFNHIITDFLASPECDSIKKSASNIEFHVSLDDNLANIKGSIVHLSKALMNFFTNGVEAMAKGGRMEISTRTVHLDTEYGGYEAVPPGKYATMTIKDTGIGMSTGELNRIFEPFYTSKVMGRSGTGLGMAVVWGTVKDHNGYIDIKSKPGEGTTFTVYIPAANGKLQEKKKSNWNDYLGSEEKILVVDDLEEQRVLSLGILQDLGYMGESASSGAEAVKMCKESSYDLLILDMIMPGGLDGLSTYEAIKAQNPGQKAIIVSGFSETDRVKKAQELGAGACLKKPYTVEALAAAIHHELHGVSNNDAAK